LFLRTLPNSSEYSVIKCQLTKSATSTGVNYEESQADSSRADFKNKVRISLREARESNYWLCVLNAIDNQTSVDLDKLIKQSNEIKNVLGSIVNKI